MFVRGELDFIDDTPPDDFSFERRSPGVKIGNIDLHATRVAIEIQDLNGLHFYHNVIALIFLSVVQTK
jgi:hypothetical protein